MKYYTHALSSLLMREFDLLLIGMKARVQHIFGVNLVIYMAFLRPKSA